MRHIRRKLVIAGPRLAGSGWRRACLAALALLAALLALPPARGVVVYKRGELKPIAGYLVRETDREIVLRQPRDGGITEDVLIPKSDIEDLIHTIDQARLSALDPDKPQDYREYADELAEKKLDPEARDTALRLYVIAAHLSRGAEAGSAMGSKHAPLLGLVALARSSEEEARFRAAAFLADPRHDPALLRSSSSIAAAPAAGADQAARAKLLEAVHHARRGKGDVAGRLIERPEIAAELAAVAPSVTKEEFLRICRTKELEASHLQTLLKLELALDPTLAAESSATDAQVDARSWSQLLKAAQPPQKPLDLVHLTEFDPRQCVYRDGKWVEP